MRGAQTSTCGRRSHARIAHIRYSFSHARASQPRPYVTRAWRTPTIEQRYVESEARPRKESSCASPGSPNRKSSASLENSKPASRPNEVSRARRHGALHGAYADSDFGDPINFYKAIGSIDFLCMVASLRAPISWLAPNPTEASRRLANYYRTCRVFAATRPT